MMLFVTASFLLSSSCVALHPSRKSSTRNDTFRSSNIEVNIVCLISINDQYNISIDKNFNKQLDKVREASFANNYLYN